MYSRTGGDNIGQDRAFAVRKGGKVGLRGKLDVRKQEEAKSGTADTA